MRTSKRILVFIMTLALCLSLFPAVALGLDDYSIQFKTNAGTATASVSWTNSNNPHSASLSLNTNVQTAFRADAGTNIVITNAAAGAGYTFSYWVDDQGNMYDASATIAANRTMVLTAVLTTPSTAAKAVRCYADGVLVAYKAVASGATYALPEAPAKTGYSFVGWYTAAAAGTLVGVAGASVTVNADVNYYAVYTVNTNLVSVATETNCDIAWTNANYAYGSTVQFSVTPESGYTMQYAKATQTSATGAAVPLQVSSVANGVVTYSFTMPNAPVYLSAYAIAASSSGSASFYADGDLWDYQAGASTANLATPTAPSKTGYTFTGWVLKGTTTPVYTSVTSLTFGTSAQVYEAVFTQNTYTVSSAANANATITGYDATYIWCARDLYG